MLHILNLKTWLKKKKEDSQHISLLSAHVGLRTFDQKWHSQIFKSLKFVYVQMNY